MTYPTKPEIDIDVRRVFERLDSASAGDVVTYKEMSDIIGRDVQNGAANVLQKAKKRQRREKQRLWETIRDHGIKLASDSDIATTIPESARLKISRVSKREAEKLATIQNFDALSREQKTAVLATQSFLGAVAGFSKPSTIKKLEDSINKSGEQKALPLAKTVEAFSK